MTAVFFFASDVLTFNRGNECMLPDISRGAGTLFLHALIDCKSTVVPCYY